MNKQHLKAKITDIKCLRSTPNINDHFDQVPKVSQVLFCFATGGLILGTFMPAVWLSRAVCHFAARSVALRGCFLALFGHFWASVRISGHLLCPLYSFQVPYLPAVRSDRLKST